MKSTLKYFDDRVRLTVLGLVTTLIYLTATLSPGLIIVLVQTVSLLVAVAAAFTVGASAYKEWHMYEGRIDIWRRELDVTVGEILNQDAEPLASKEAKE